MLAKEHANSNRSNKLAISGTPLFTHTSTLLQCLHEERIVRSPSSWVRGPQCKIGVLMMQDLFRNFIFWSERYQGLPGKTGCWWFRHSDISDGHWFVERKSIHHYKEVFTWCNGPFFLSRPKFIFFLQLKVRYPWDEVRTLVLNQRGPTEVTGRLPRCNSDVFLPHLTKSLHLSRVQIV